MFRFRCGLSAIDCDEEYESSTPKGGFTTNTAHWELPCEVTPSGWGREPKPNPLVGAQDGSEYNIGYLSDPSSAHSISEGERLSRKSLSVSDKNKSGFCYVC